MSTCAVLGVKCNKTFGSEPPFSFNWLLRPLFFLVNGEGYLLRPEPAPKQWVCSEWAGQYNKL